MHHAKLEEIIHDDFFHYEPIQPRLGRADACFFCLGVSSAGMAAEHVPSADLRPHAGCRQVDGAGEPGDDFLLRLRRGDRQLGARAADRWARVKGKTENDAAAAAVQGGVHASAGVYSAAQGREVEDSLYQSVYVVLGWLYPVLHALLPRYTTTTVVLGRAMIRLAVEGDAQRVLSTADINRVGEERM